MTWASYSIQTIIKILKECPIGKDGATLGGLTTIGGTMLGVADAIRCEIGIYQEIFGEIEIDDEKFKQCIRYILEEDREYHPADGLHNNKFIYLRLLESVKKIVNSGAFRIKTEVGADEIGDEEYDVLSLCVRGEKGDAVLACEITASSCPIGYPLKNVKVDVHKSAVDDFNKKNEKRYKFAQRFLSPHNVTLLSAKESMEIIRPKDGVRNEKYRNTKGVNFLSRVGFNADKTQAIFENGFQTGPLNGIGMLHILSKESGIWTIKDGFMQWVS